MVLTLGTEVPSTPADGLVNTIWVPSIKNIQKPTAAEIGVGTDLSNYVTLGGWSCSPSAGFQSPTSARTARRIMKIPDARRSAVKHRGHRQHQHFAFHAEHGDGDVDRGGGRLLRATLRQADRQHPSQPGDVVNVYSVRIGMSARWRSPRTACCAARSISPFALPVGPRT